MGLADLDSLNGRPRLAPSELAKPLPRVLVKAADHKAKKDRGDVFRKAVWKRDEGRSRATGNPLGKSGTVDPMRLGEVDHAYLRSTDPDKIYDVSNGILIEKALNRLRKVVCPRAPEFKMFNYEGPDDRKKPQHFIWRDADGNITKERWG